MSGIVHFKFKSSNSYDTITFDGAFVSVGELKALIAEKKDLRDAAAELVLSDPRTQVEYTDDAAMVPKSSSVLVRRVPNLHATPLMPQSKAASKPQPAQQTATPQAEPEPEPSAPQTNGQEEDFGDDLFTEQRDEDAVLNQLLEKTGEDWQKEVRASTARGRGRGRGRDFGGRGAARGRGRDFEQAPRVLPKNYICFRCGQPGHFIEDCPSSGDPDVKRIAPALGIPHVLLKPSDQGGLLLPDGSLATLQPDREAFQREVGLMPGGKSAVQKQGATPPPDSTAQPSSSNAMVVFNSEAGPALAGGGDFDMAFNNPAGLLLPPNVDMAMPSALPLPDEADTPSGQKPMSREDFLKMQDRLRREQERDRRRSRSGSPRRRHRHRDRDSRSPRHRASPWRDYRSRRHRSRTRSPSRERPTIYLRRRSPSPRLYRRLSPPSPYSRRPRHYSPADHRRKDSASPSRRRNRAPEAGRWQPEEHGTPSSVGRSPKAKQTEADILHSFGNTMDSPTAKKAVQHQPKKSTSLGMSAPELMGEDEHHFFSRTTEASGFPSGAKMDAQRQSVHDRIQPLGENGTKSALPAAAQDESAQAQPRDKSTAKHASEKIFGTGRLQDVSKPSASTEQSKKEHKEKKRSKDEKDRSKKKRKQDLDDPPERLKRRSVDGAQREPVSGHEAKQKADKGRSDKEAEGADPAESLAEGLFRKAYSGNPLFSRALAEAGKQPQKDSKPVETSKKEHSESSEDKGHSKKTRSKDHKEHKSKKKHKSKHKRSKSRHRDASG